MTFRKLAEFFQELESTSSRNTMVEILAELFSQAQEREIEKIVYLTQGRVAPLFEPVEFGMADKMVIKAMAEAFEKDVSEVTKEFKKSGDLGKTAEGLSLRLKDKSLKSQLTVGEVFEKLYLITQTGGEGSVEKKIGILAELFFISDSLSVRYIARIPVDKLRLGFSDMTVLEGLSWMIDKTKRHKAEMETAYNIRPDLGFIAENVKRSGTSGIKSVKPVVGTPILVMRAERLTNAEEILEKGNGKMAVEPKVDGFRLQLHFKRGTREIIEKGAEERLKTENVKQKAGISKKMVAVELFSRGLEHVTTMYPEIVAAAEKEIKAHEVILDGEAIAYNPKTGKFLPFQETVQRKRKYNIEQFSKDVPLRYIVFDCLYFDGKSLIDQPYTQRREMIGRALVDGKDLSNRTIVQAEMKLVQKGDDLEKIFEETLRKGLEGIMAKKLDGVYQAGARGWNWIKLKGSYTGKLADTVDAVVMGIDFGQGKRNSFGVGAFLVGVYDQNSDSFKTISKIGTGLSDEEWRQLTVDSRQLTVKEKPQNYDVNRLMECDVWLTPKLVGEFRADELTRSPMHTAGFALRFPRLVVWREKNPEDATSLKEIEEMYVMQKK